MLYEIKDGTVSVGGEEILTHICFQIKEKEKIALVGKNGAGKTTLLRLLAGELELDRDDRRKGAGIERSRKISVGFLRQTLPETEERTVEELAAAISRDTESYSREQYAKEAEFNRLFTGFGFSAEERKRKIHTFSGGEQTKIMLLLMLLQKPDLLLLDEPTNHLDVKTVQWLEDYLIHYEKAVLIVSHDRYFLDRTAEAVYELEDGVLTKYPGNYTAYRMQKRKHLEILRREYERQQAEISRLEDLIERFKHKPKKASFARSRRTMLERMEKAGAPKEEEAHIFTGTIEPLVPGNKWVIEAEHLKIGYDKVLAEVFLKVRRGQKIAIIGENGAGKSTLLKTIAGFIPPLKGRLSLGSNMIFGYFDQNSGALESELTVAEHFQKCFPSMTQKDIRKTLASYLFRGGDASIRVSDLSGGEKARLVLCEILSGRPNLLLLDEPTNHMDIPAKETLESAFAAYTGTILFVSHDRYLVSKVADAILEVNGEEVRYYPFDYEHYLRKQREGMTPEFVRAQEQALIADLKAVPEAEKHRLAEIGTEEAYLDWKFRLAKEPMEEAREKVEHLWQERSSMEEAYSCLLWNGGTEQEVEECRRKLDTLTEKLDRSWAMWTQCCLEWFEVFTNAENCGTL